MAVDAISEPRRGVLVNRDFGCYLSGVFLGTLAIQIQSVAVSWQIYAIARNPLALGYAGLAQFLPMVLFILPAGSFADRYDRRTIIAISYLLQAAAAALFLWLALTNTRALAPWYAILALFGAARSFASPAAQSLVPQLVPQGQFPQAVALNSSIFQVAVIAGPALGGSIYILGPATAYAACLVMFAVVTGLTFAIRSHTPAFAPDGQSTTLERLTAGIRYVSQSSTDSWRDHP